jgi:uncharacterized protein
MLVLPGWGDSGPGHWQSLWERARPDFVRVQQDNWDLPNLDRWVATLDEAVAACPEPPVLIAHSLGCTTVAHWVARSPAAGVRAALLVAPPDIDQLDQPEIVGFRPVPTPRFPFPTFVVGSRNDPWMTAERAARFAEAWGGRFIDAGEVGHLNIDAGYGPWPEGERLLTDLLALTFR